MRPTEVTLLTRWLRSLRGTAVKLFMSRTVQITAIFTFLTLSAPVFSEGHNTWLREPSHEATSSSSSSSSASGNEDEAAEDLYTFRQTGTVMGGGEFGYMNSCGVLQIGSSRECDEVKTTRKFAKFMAEHIPDCVSAALRATGRTGNYKRIKVDHMGTYAHRRVNHRRNGKWSMHATGRSIDLSGFQILLTNDQVLDIDMTRNGRRRAPAFYDTFVACWREANKKRDDCSSMTRNAGALDCTYNRLHHDHVHLSMPFCPRQRGISAD